MMPSNCICECLSTRTMPMDDGRASVSKPEMIWEEDSHSAPSRTSSTSGYRENCSLLMMPMGSSDERSSSPVHLHHHHNCLTASCSTIMPADSPCSVATATGGSDREMSGNEDVGSQQTIVTYEQEDTLLWAATDDHLFGFGTTTMATETMVLLLFRRWPVCKYNRIDNRRLKHISIDNKELVQNIILWVRPAIDVLSSHLRKCGYRMQPRHKTHLIFS